MDEFSLLMPNIVIKILKRFTDIFGLKTMKNKNFAKLLKKYKNFKIQKIKLKVLKSYLKILQILKTFISITHV